MENVSIIDIISISLILILGIKGVINGFIKEIFGLIGIIGGLFLASRYADLAGNFIDRNLYSFDNKASIYLLGFISVLILFWILSIFAGFILGSLLKMSGLGGLDKLAGFIIGSLKIFLLLSILIVTLSHIEFIKTKMDTYMKNSIMYPIFLETGNYIMRDTQQIVKQIDKKI